MNIVYELAEYLEDHAIGTMGSDIFIGSLSDDLANGIMLVSTSNGSNRTDYPLFEENIEIWTRNQSTESGYNKAKAIFDLLHRLENVTLTNAHLYFIHSNSGVESIGRDIDGRALHKLMVNVTYRDLQIS